MSANENLGPSERDHNLGPRSAPFTLVEYADYECPYCRMADKELKELKKRFGNRVNLVFRNFPLNDIHPRAQLAAEAAEAAGAQGKFWEMHDLLLNNQRDLELETILGYAEGLGLDTDRFLNEIEEGIYRRRVAHDLREGERAGVDSTPTIFINGEKFEGQWDAESLAEKLDELHLKSQH